MNQNAAIRSVPWPNLLKIRTKLLGATFRLKNRDGQFQGPIQAWGIDYRSLAFVLSHCNYRQNATRQWRVMHESETTVTLNTTAIVYAKLLKRSNLIVIRARQTTEGKEVILIRMKSLTFGGTT